MFQHFALSVLHPRFVRVFGMKLWFLDIMWRDSCEVRMRLFNPSCEDRSSAMFSAINCLLLIGGL